MQAKLTGVILAGGKSSRMGSNKALMEIKNKAMIEHVVDSLRIVSDEIIIIANDNSYSKLGYPVYADEFPECGPIAGIYTALLHTKNEKNLIVSCDIPFVGVGIFNALIKQMNKAEIIVPRHNNQVEPLCSIYSKVCLNRIKALIEKGEYKMQASFARFKTCYVAFNEEEAEKNFVNLNTIDDFNKYSKP